MAWTRGDVVLIPFPFSDLRAIKARPTIVVSTSVFHTIRQELLLAYLTSQAAQLHPIFDYLLVDWQAAGLLKPSVMKPRVAIIQETLVQHHVGTLSDRDMVEVDRRLRRAMNLNMTALDDALTETDLTRHPPASVQRLAEAGLGAVRRLHDHGDQTVDLGRLRSLFPPADNL